MDITTVAAMATQMEQTKQAFEMSVAVAKKGLDVQKMLGAGALELIQSAGDIVAQTSGKGTHLNIKA